MYTIIASICCTKGRKKNLRYRYRELNTDRQTYVRIIPVQNQQVQPSYIVIIYKLNIFDRRICFFVKKHVLYIYTHASMPTCAYVLLVYEQQVERKVSFSQKMIPENPFSVTIFFYHYIILEGRVYAGLVYSLCAGIVCGVVLWR